MSVFEGMILGIVEGLTEFLPISSTGHLTIVSHFLGIIQNNQFIFFEIAIQLGAILAVVVFFWKKFLQPQIIKLLIAGFLPTAILGFVFYKLVKSLLTQEYLIVATLIIGGIVILLVERWFVKIISEGADLKEIISIKQAFILGVCQSIAMIPGVSRSGAIIVSGLLMKIKRKTVAEFSFLLAVPTMLSATLYSLLKERHSLFQLDSSQILSMAVGFLVAFLVATLVIKFLLAYIRKNDFRIFGWYRIFFGLFILLMLYS